MTSTFPPVPKKASHSAQFTYVSGSTGKHTTQGNMTVKHIISGAVKYEINGEEKILFSGDTLIMNPHDEVVFEALGTCRHYSFIFDQPRFFDDLCIPALARFSNFIEKDAIIKDICIKVNSEYENVNPFHENMLISLTNQLLIHLYRNYSTINPDSPSSHLLGKHKIARLAVDYIYKNCHKGITTSEISTHINVSSSYLCRCFKEATGLSILEFAERIRCRKAMEDLSLGKYSVTQIAEKYHFNSLSYFNRRYNKYCGENPAKTLSDAKKRRN